MTPSDPARDLVKQAEKAEAQAVRFLSVLRVAERCGVTTRTVRNWIRSGALEAVRLPAARGQKRIHHRVPLSAVEKIASRHLEGN